MSAAFAEEGLASDALVSPINGPAAALVDEARCGMSEPLHYRSTRGAKLPRASRQVIAAGLAPDGGLYVPEALPPLDVADFDGGGTLADTAALARAVLP